MLISVFLTYFISLYELNLNSVLLYLSQKHFLKKPSSKDFL